MIDVRLGAACALLSAALLAGAAGTAVRLRLPLGTPPFRPAATLAEIRGRRPALLLRQLLLLAATLLLFPVGPALGRVLDGAGRITEVAVAAWMAGTAVAVANDLLVVGALVWMIPFHSARDDAACDCLEGARGKMDAAVRATQLLGDALLIGIGAGVFALAIARTGALPVWSGWLGMVAAVLGGFVHRPAALLGRRGEVLRKMGAAGFVLFVLWLVAVGMTQR